MVTEPRTSTEPVLLWAALPSSPVTYGSPSVEPCQSGHAYAWLTVGPRNVVLKMLEDRKDSQA